MTTDLTGKAEYYGQLVRELVTSTLRNAREAPGMEDPFLTEELITEHTTKAAHYAGKVLGPVPFKIRIVHDRDASSPREDDNLGIMYCEHRRYRLGDEDASSPLEECPACEGCGTRYTVDPPVPCDSCAGRGKRLREDLIVCLPLGLYDHSGITMYVGGRHAQDSAGWDSGQVGCIYVDRERFRKEYGPKARATKKRIAQIEAILRSEVECYAQHLEGQRYGFIVEDSHGEQIDSCWGFYGTDWKTNGMAEHWDKDTRELAEREGVCDAEYD